MKSILANLLLKKIVTFESIRERERERENMRENECSIKVFVMMALRIVWKWCLSGSVH